MFWPDTITAQRLPCSAERSRISAANARAKPDRHIDRVELWAGGEQVVGVGREPEHQVAVERSAVFVAARGRDRDRSLARLVEVAAMLDQFRAERLHGGVLLDRI